MPTMTATLPPTSVPTSDGIFHAPLEVEFDFYAPKYHYFICGHRLHVKIAAVLAVLVSFLSFLSINLAAIIMFRFAAVYFTFVVGCLMFFFFFYGCRQYNRWLILAYINFLAAYEIGLIVVIVFGICFWRAPDKEILARFNSYDGILYKVMTASSAIFFLLNIFCILIIYRLFQLLCDRKSAISSLPHLETHDDYRARRNFFTNLVRGSQGRESSEAPICVISYPPPCPPAYEAVASPTSSDSPNTPRRPRRKTHRNTQRIVLPQYTDFRPGVYAEPPPYEEKPEIQNYH